MSSITSEVHLFLCCCTPTYPTTPLNPISSAQIWLSFSAIGCLNCPAAALHRFRAFRLSFFFFTAPPAPPLTFFYIHTVTSTSPSPPFSYSDDSPLPTRRPLLPPPSQEFTDEEIRKLEEQWDKDEELEDEDLPPWKRPPPPTPAFDPANIDMNVRFGCLTMMRVNCVRGVQLVDGVVCEICSPGAECAV